MSGLLLVVTDDPVLPATLVGLARERDAALEVRASVAEIAAGPTPDAVVVDLLLAGALAAPRALRARWPRALLAGSLALPRRELWDEALASGYDMVANRGAVANRLRAMLATWTGPAARRIRLVELADIAGRIGVVHRVDDPTVGRLAVYHLGGHLFAASDRCPHAGGQLSLGELEDCVVTCPLHGSQFDVRTGERMRGPADDPVEVYPVVIEGGVAYAEVARGA